MTVFRLYFKQKAEIDVRPEDVDEIRPSGYRMIVDIGDAEYLAHRIEKVEREEDAEIPLQ